MDWISVKERLPDFEGVCFVYAPSADPDKPLYAHAWWLVDERRWALLVPYWAAAVTHWMRPTPPQSRVTTYLTNQAACPKIRA